MRRSFRPLGAVFRAALLAILDALRVEHAAQDVVADARQILDAAAADHHHRVLLQIVSLAGDVADHLKAVGQTNLGDFAQRRIRLLRRRRIDAGADAALLRARAEVAGLLAVGLRSPRLADQLTDRRHRNPCPKKRTLSLRLSAMAPKLTARLARTQNEPRLKAQRLKARNLQRITGKSPKIMRQTRPRTQPV